MEFLTELWLPIVLSAVFVFFVSSILHMVIPHHKSDYRGLPDEEKVLDAMRAQNVGRGEYMFPFPSSMKELGNPEMIAKFERGPVGYLTVIPSGPPAMGKSLVQWFVYTLVVSAFVAYIADLAMGPTQEYLRVFRVTGAIAVLVYGIACVNDSIWKGKPWSTTAKFVFDGVIYGLVTAGTFGWLWPTA